MAHNECATPPCGLFLPGPKGDLGKGAPAALQMLAGSLTRLRFAPCWRPFAESRQPPFSVNRP